MKKPSLAIQNGAAREGRKCASVLLPESFDPRGSCTFGTHLRDSPEFSPLSVSRLIPKASRKYVVG